MLRRCGFGHWFSCLVRFILTSEMEDVSQDDLFDAVEAEERREWEELRNSKEWKETPSEPGMLYSIPYTLCLHLQESYCSTLSPPAPHILRHKAKTLSQMLFAPEDETKGAGIIDFPFSR
ncbi:hypothetical protein E6C27_scaffold48403G00020 [Cucumis melo var. makuwa]|uniref:Uncharacterized protein n=1 Tax=Cucumis melo var. makuwa TaxID=1194695 RepID=A0A5A7SWH3_CUCMM|nr:hypothetical protein E6C27_scaffold48403G00020 [Cucumis melo var. makuwa]